MCKKTCFGKFKESMQNRLIEQKWIFHDLPLCVVLSEIPCDQIRQRGHNFWQLYEYPKS